MENDKKAEEERTKYAKKNANLNLERLTDNFKGRKKWYKTEFLENFIRDSIKALPDSIQVIRSSHIQPDVIRLDGIEVYVPLNGGAASEPVEEIAERADIARSQSSRVLNRQTSNESRQDDELDFSSPLLPVSKNNSGNQIQGKATPIVESKTELSAYSSSEAYFAEMKALEGEAFWDKYFENKVKFVNAIGYYIDVAELLTQKNNPENAEEIITNIAELGDENQEFMRVVAYKLQNLKKYELAKQIFEYIAEIRAEEPQSFRDLAIINEEIGNYQEAADLYYKVVIGEWDWRFSGIEITALTELNILIAKHPKEIETTKYNPELLFAMPLDVRVVLRWDLDNTDIDLWVTDSRNEKCWYGNKNTKIGGMLPRDFTAGNGPEEFLLKSAMKGKYIIECNYFGSRATKLTGGTTIFLDIYTNYGKPNEKKETKIMRLKDVKGTIKIGEIEIE